jgi:hypothetical protein
MRTRTKAEYIVVFMRLLESKFPVTEVGDSLYITTEKGVQLCPIYNQKTWVVIYHLNIQTSKTKIFEVFTTWDDLVQYVFDLLYPLTVNDVLNQGGSPLKVE